VSSVHETQNEDARETDLAPGDEPRDPQHIPRAVRNYLLGLALAIALTAASFWATQTHLIYGPGVPMALSALAVAQMGIHLVFFLHITTAPDNTNNVLALAFGLLIVCIVVLGSLWIMNHLDHNVHSMGEMLQMQR
jgi:cytochrome o ubiquinol oxidase operon protein cyoD